MVQIRILDNENHLICETAHPQDAGICLDHAWQEGDRIVLQAPPGSHLQVCIDTSALCSEVYLPEGKMTWKVPFGEHRTAYRPGAFDGTRHIVTARLMEKTEILTWRDIARNPLDLRGETDFFPHCTANVETRNESVFAARNVIDGLRFNSFHGEWPYESWGIGAREDAWCMLDFGRNVRADRMALTLRADFPHDAYWVSGHVVTSGGKDVAFDLEKTPERQWIDLGEETIRWLRLERMVKSNDPSAFPSLRAWEVYGYDPEE